MTIKVFSKLELDNQGNLIKILHYSGTGDLVSDEKLKFFYDQGNLIWMNPEPVKGIQV